MGHKGDNLIQILLMLFAVGCPTEAVVGMCTGYVQQWQRIVVFSLDRKFGVSVPGVDCWK